MTIDSDEIEKETKINPKKIVSIRIALTAITAALYIVLGYLFQATSFLGLQFRVAEIIVGMCIIFPMEGLIGNVIGVFFLNITSPLGLIDLLSCIVNIPALYCIIALRNRGFLKYLGGIFYSIIISIYVAAILLIVLSLPFWINFIQVLISEVILSSVGILVFSIVKSRLDLSQFSFAN